MSERAGRIVARAGGAVALAAALLVVFRCTEFPTRFERIDADRMRVLQVAYHNLSDTAAGLCEAAPGDSMLLVMCLAGQSLTDIEWEVSWNVFISPYGADSAYDRRPLDFVPATLSSANYTDSTEVVAIKFRVPDSIFAISRSISDDALAMLGVDRATGVAIVDTFARMTPQERAQDTLLGPLVAEFAPVVTQILSAPVRIFATINGVNRTYGDLTVRYNRLLRDYPTVTVNHNPQVRFMGVYKVKGQQVGFAPGDLNGDDTTICLFTDGTVDSTVMGDNANIVYGDTVLVDLGYSYYVAIDSGLFAGTESRDSTQPLFFNVQTGSISLGTRVPEDYYTRWFYQFEADEIEGLSQNELMVISNTGAIVTPMYPPLSSSITHASLWVQVYDYFTGEWQRPVGSSLIESRIHFKFTPAYLDSAEKLQ